MTPSPGVRARLDQWKNQLIDTTKKNRLLFFTPLKTGSVQLTDPDPESLFDRLVTDLSSDPCEQINNPWARFDVQPRGAENAEIPLKANFSNVFSPRPLRLCGEIALT